MRKLSIAILIAATAVMVALTGCGGGGGGSTGGGNTTTGVTIITGTVVDNRRPAHTVANVVVDLGGLPATTEANGRFTFTLGTDFAVSGLFASPSDAVFKVSTRLLPADQYPQVSVFFRGVGYEQLAQTGGSTIPLPIEAYLAVGITVDIGVVTVQFNDATLPPPPPFP